MKNILRKNILLQIVIAIMASILVSCATTPSSPRVKGSILSQPNASPTASVKNDFWQNRPDAVWNELQHLSTARLAQIQASSSGDIAAWAELALISKHDSTNTPQLVRDLINWRERHPSHPGNSLFPSDANLTQLLNNPPPQHIALLLPLHGSYASSGQSVRDGFLNAYYSGMRTARKQSLSFLDTSTHNVQSLYQQAVSQGADYVVGPLLKENVQQLANSGSFPVQTQALNYTKVRFGSLPNNFYEFGLLPEDEVSQIAERARQNGLSRAIVIAPQNAWGNRLVATFNDQWKALGGKVQDTWFYGAPSTFNQNVAQLMHVNISSDKELMKKQASKSELEQQRRQDFDVIFLFSQPQAAREIVPLLRFYYANNVPIYATSSLYTGKANRERDADLRGVIVCDIPGSFQSNSHNRLYAVGQDAYLLGQALPRLVQLPNFPLYGKTGALVMSPQHQIHRRTPCVAINNGSL